MRIADALGNRPDMNMPFETLTPACRDSFTFLSSAFALRGGHATSYVDVDP
jgi:hypothetical protein